MKMIQTVSTPQGWHRCWREFLARFGLGLAVGLGLSLLSVTPSMQATPPARIETVTLPPLRTIPLPPSLASLPEQPVAGDYFDRIQPTELGALIWTAFPIKVYTYPAQHNLNASVWLQAAQQAIQEWQVYLPLQSAQQPEEADIILRPVTPRDQGTGRVRSAETTYQPYINSQGLLDHRCTILVRPSQAPQFLLAALRHELGHALGIWGHSPLPSDALYFSQVRQPPPISPRDVNTLRRVYQQPTRLGGPVAAVSKPQSSGTQADSR